MSLLRRLLKKKRTLPPVGEMSRDELLALMRHETHRIEKAVYNGILTEKADIFARKRDRLADIHRRLSSMGVPDGEPTVAWSKKMLAGYDSLERDVIRKESTEPPPFTPKAADEFLSFLKSRRSVRVWADEQPSADEFAHVVDIMIEAARWAPNSGNRQAWRYAILDTPKKRVLLERLKERHCTTAPLLIFIGADTRVYGALGEEERCLYIDIGAAVMQMILVAHRIGLGTCWNHFADDLVKSRPVNEDMYRRFTETLGIPGYITPVAVVAVGRARYIPPVPARMEPDSFCACCGDAGGSSDS